MIDINKVIKGIDTHLGSFECKECPYTDKDGMCWETAINDALVLLRDQASMLRKEYERGYVNGRSDEAGLRDGTIMQTFSPD